MARVAVARDDAWPPLLRRARPARDDAQRAPHLAEHGVRDAVAADGDRGGSGQHHGEHGDQRDVVDRRLAALAVLAVVPAIRCAGPCFAMPSRLPGIVLRIYTSLPPKNPNFVPELCRGRGGARRCARCAVRRRRRRPPDSSAWARPTSRQPPATRSPASQPAAADAELAGTTNGAASTTTTSGGFHSAVGSPLSCSPGSTGRAPASERRATSGASTASSSATPASWPIVAARAIRRFADGDEQRRAGDRTGGGEDESLDAQALAIGRRHRGRAGAFAKGLLHGGHASGSSGESLCAWAVAGAGWQGRSEGGGPLGP